MMSNYKLYFNLKLNQFQSSMQRTFFHPVIFENFFEITLKLKVFKNVLLMRKYALYSVVVD